MFSNLKLSQCSANLSPYLDGHLEVHDLGVSGQDVPGRRDFQKVGLLVHRILKDEINFNSKVAQRDSSPLDEISSRNTCLQ